MKKLITLISLLSSLTAFGNDTGHAYTGNQYYSFAEVNDEDGKRLENTPLEYDGWIYSTARYGGINDTNFDGAGVMFKVRIPTTDDYANTGRHYTIVHRFDANGSRPTGPIVATNGYIYGCVTYGGDFGGGAVFRISTNGTGYTHIYSFKGKPDGAYPNWLLLGQNGMLYGTTYYGGNKNRGTLFAMNLDGNNYNILKNFGTLVNADTKSFNIVQGTNFIGHPITWGPVQTGTTIPSRTIKKYTATYPIGISMGYDNKIYGVTEDVGITNHNGTIFSINLDGSGYTEIADLAEIDASDPTPPTLMSNGIIYGTTTRTNSGNNPYSCFYKVQNGKISKVNTKSNELINTAIFTAPLIETKNGYIGTYQDAPGTGLFLMSKDENTFTILYNSRTEIPCTDSQILGITGFKPNIPRDEATSCSFITVGQNGIIYGASILSGRHAISTNFSGCLFALYPTDFKPFWIYEPPDTAITPNGKDWSVVDYTSACCIAPNIESYEWRNFNKYYPKGTGQISDGLSVLHGYLNVGDQIQAIAHFNGGLSITSRLATVYNTGIPSVSTHYVNMQAIVGTTITLKSTVTGGLPTPNIHWFGNNNYNTNTIALGYDQTVTFTMPTNDYTITLVAANVVGTNTTIWYISAIPDTNGPSITITYPKNTANIVVLRDEDILQRVTFQGTTENNCTGITGTLNNNTITNITIIGNQWYATAVVKGGCSNTIDVVATNSKGNTGAHAKSTFYVSYNSKTPTLTITNPKQKSRVNINTTFSGNCISPAAIGYIERVMWTLTNYTDNSCSSGRFIPATNGVWNLTTTINPGSNNLIVVAYDRDGNNKTTNVVFFALQQSLITLTTSGNGYGTFKATTSIKGDTIPANGAYLNIGEDYTITAVPNNTSWFKQWTCNGFVNTNTLLKFKMTNGMNINAQFDTNVFIETAGTYNGIFLGTPASTTSAGQIQNFIVTKTGAFSTKIKIGKNTYSTSGSETKQATITKTFNGFTLTLSLTDNTVKYLSGILTGPNWNAPITLYPIDTTQTGNFTYVIDEENTLLDGTYEAINIQKGSSKITGALRGYKTVTQTSSLGIDGTIPWFQTLGTITAIGIIDIYNINNTTILISDNGILTNSTGTTSQIQSDWFSPANWSISLNTTYSSTIDKNGNFTGINNNNEKLSGKILKTTGVFTITGTENNKKWTAGGIIYTNDSGIGLTTDGTTTLNLKK